MSQISRINSIDGFGVLSNYRHSAGIDDFSSKNVIYGWNYSGKTTLSRIFQCISEGALSSQHADASFNFAVEGGGELSESFGTGALSHVRVFNTDFVTDNISWDGEDFDAILILGEDSIEAQEQIRKLTSILERCRLAFRRTKTEITEIDNTISQAKRTQASTIKTKLSLVETFTATHLGQIIGRISSSPENHILGEETQLVREAEAASSSSDRLHEIGKVNIRALPISNIDEIRKHLASTPPLTNTMEALSNNPELSNWIESGLKLHGEQEDCNFCGNALDSSRLSQFKMHFSKDKADFDEKTISFIKLLEDKKITCLIKHPSEFYTAYRENAGNVQEELKGHCEKYCNDIESICFFLKKKNENPYEKIEAFSENPSLRVESIEVATSKVNSIIEKCNEITKNFDSTKSTAIQQLKDHYVAEFLLDSNRIKSETELVMKSNHLKRFQRLGENLKAKIDELNAQISQAQKGREEVNEYIGKFLPWGNIRIEVVEIDSNERFQLLRNDERASNLSEGEKTAIAFSFFLVKLKEFQEISNLVIFIDDPISSLDSNHLFQVNAVIKSEFFEQDQNNDNQWKLKVKQLFLSTHNFEFFNLLRELPLNKSEPIHYFMMARQSEGKSKLVNMPPALLKYSSEYQYLWSVIYEYHESADKQNHEILLLLPNAVRRFMELYTYAKIPSTKRTSVDQRARVLLGEEKSKRLLKVLHFFSHSNNPESLARNSDLLCDLENVVNDLVELVRNDSLHYEALMEAVAV
ncbi:AAA family ATPase [Pseudomonadales bacterium]|nr:AAA family ATPase [Pseudomonadales bacterium]